MYKKIKINEFTIITILLFILCGYIKRALFIFIILFIHELGHLFCCFIFKYDIEKIEIYPFGGILHIKKNLNNIIWYDILLSLGGILFQLPLFLIDDLEFLQINKYILLFNLLPIIPLDGSNLMFEIYNYHFSYKTSLTLYIITSWLFIFCFIAYSYFCYMEVISFSILFIIKTIEITRKRKQLLNKFIIERLLYNLSYSKIDYNIPIKKYQKGYKYYYYIKDKIIDEKEYLKLMYKG